MKISFVSKKKAADFEQAKITSIDKISGRVGISLRNGLISSATYLYDINDLRVGTSVLVGRVSNTYVIMNKVSNMPRAGVAYSLPKPVPVSSYSWWKQLDITLEPSGWRKLFYLGNGVVMSGQYSGQFSCQRSFDFGLTWSLVVVPNGDINYFSPIGNEGIIMAKSYLSPNSRIIRSIDYGATWNIVYSGDSSTCFDFQTGVVWAYRAMSNDYGKTWTAVSPPPVAGVTVYSLTFISPGVAWGRVGGKLYITYGSGVNWTWLRNDVNGTVESLVSLGNGVGLCTGSGLTPGPAYGLYRTTDYGVNWSLIEFPIPDFYPGFFVQAQNVLFYSTYYYSSGSYIYKLARSYDGGISWEILSVPWDEDRMNSFVYLGNNCCACGDGLQTFDYGDTWLLYTQIVSDFDYWFGLTDDWGGVEPVSLDNGLAVGVDKTTNHIWRADPSYPSPPNIPYPEPGLPWAIRSGYTQNISTVIHSGYTYNCKLTHISKSISEPGVGSLWRTYWKKMS